MLGKSSNSCSRTIEWLTLEQLELTHQNIDQSRFTSTIRTSNSNSRIHIHTKLDILIQNFIRRVTKHTIFDFQDGGRNIFGFRESEMNTLFHMNFFNDFHLFKFFHSALSHRSTTIVSSKFSHNSFIFSDFILLFLIFFHLLFDIFISGFFKLVIISLVIMELGFEKVNCMSTDII